MLNSRQVNRRPSRLTRNPAEMVKSVEMLAASGQNVRSTFPTLNGLPTMNRLPLMTLTVLLTTACHGWADDTKPTPVPGVIINHSPPSSQQYIGSPSIAVLPNGDYVASHDYFMAGDKGDITKIFVSTDRGESWSHRATIQGQWWSTLFVHNGDLYLIGTKGAKGAGVIRKSTDQGRTWTEPKDTSTGLLLPNGMYHCAPMPVVVHNGRIWRTMEDGTGTKGWDRHFFAMMLSAPVDADLLDASNWTVSTKIQGLRNDNDWLDGKFRSWFEGNAVVTPEGKMVNILRVDQPGYPEKVAVAEVSPDGKKLTFDDPRTGFRDFPGGGKKFTIRFDPKSKRYWSLANHVPKEFQDKPGSSRRNTLALISSADLVEWTVEKIVLSHPDPTRHGYQYPDFLFEKDDIIAVVRTAHTEPDGTQAKNFHDANYLTFHRIPNFRNHSKLGKP